LLADFSSPELFDALSFAVLAVPKINIIFCHFEKKNIFTQI